MVRKKVMSGLGAMILIALLASGSGGTKTAFAENQEVVKDQID